jgi:hypothetical protein
MVVIIVRPVGIGYLPITTDTIIVFADIALGVMDIGHQQLASVATENCLTVKSDHNYASQA